jgi:flagellar hook protein FlgE
MKKTVTFILTLLFAHLSSLVIASPVKDDHSSPAKRQIVTHIQPDVKPITDLTELLHGKYVFALRDPGTGAVSYTQLGSFYFKDDEYLYQAGKRLQGYQLSTSLLGEACNLSDLRFGMLLPPQQTSRVNLRVNLNASSRMPEVAFHPEDPASYNYMLQFGIFDVLGFEHVSSLYFVKQFFGSWQIYYIVDGSVITEGHLTFESTGKIEKVNGLEHITFWPNAANPPQEFSISLDDSTQYASDTHLFYQRQDGRTAGHLNGVDIDDIGNVDLLYSSGEKISAGKIAVLRA